MSNEVILYCRVSSDEQKTERLSIEHQERTLRQYCDGNGLQVFHKVFKEDYSAKHFDMRRPEIKQKKVSFHVSRHSFAYQALQDDIDPMTIKGALAHGSLLTTETYLKDFEIQELDNTLQRMFDKQSVKDKALKLLRSLSLEDREEVIRLCQEA